jgi:hypothetical protein
MTSLTLLLRLKSRKTTKWVLNHTLKTTWLPMEKLWKITKKTIKKRSKTTPLNEKKRKNK